MSGRKGTFEERARMVKVLRRVITTLEDDDPDCYDDEESFEDLYDLDDDSCAEDELH